MYNVSVKVKRRKSIEAGKRMPLYVQIIYRREVRKMALPYQLSEEEWDGGREEINIPGESTSERLKELYAIREQFSRDCRTVRSVIYLKEKKGSFTPDEIVEACKERFAVANLTKYVEKQICVLQGEGKDETARHYQSTLNAFMHFRGGCELRLDEIDAPLLKEFETYLFSSGVCANTVSFYLRVLRAIRNRAVRDNLVEAIPQLFSNVHTGIEKTRKRAVQENVILGLVALQLLSPALQLARDLFLFSYYARGMAFVDLAQLTRKNIVGDKIVYIRRKTGQELQIRLLPEMRRLIARYQYVSGPFLFPVLTGSRPDYIGYQSALRVQNKRLKKLGKLVGADLSTYIARHTWASVAAQKGIPEELISQGMGHESVKTTRIYMALLDTSRVDRANEIVIHKRDCKSKPVYKVVL